MSTVFFIYKTSNDGQGGKHVLGLDGAWVVFRRAGKGVEIGLGGRRKVRALNAFFTIPVEHLP